LDYANLFMKPDIKIDKSKPTPIFRQIIQEIEQAINNGSLKTGERLPTERELAVSLAVARGTVTRAYAELTNEGRIDRVQGRGSIVSGQAAPERSGRKERAQSLIRGLVDALTGMKLSFPEMKAMVDLAITEREEALATLSVAAVDCNPETLGMFERQIGLLSRVSVRTYLLDDLARDRDPGARLRDFSLILTTTTHHRDLCALAPELKALIVPVSVSPSRETILRLASVGPGQGIGVLCESRKFFSIVQLQLRDLRIQGPLDALFPPRAPGALAEFIRERKALILSPGEQAATSREEARALQAFTERGGNMVTFDYQIERGSLARVEERINEIVERRTAARPGESGR
jgi:DNA-binding transcriptional regulator YhcF (GntR family)